jgi:hypothetical protein
VYEKEEDGERSSGQKIVALKPVLVFGFAEISDKVRRRLTLLSSYS